MSNPHIKTHATPHFDDAVMLMGFSGWMDGGDVSTGTLEYLTGALPACPMAQISAEHFNILNFPGSMEVSALFRPHIKIEAGLVKNFDPPVNSFHYVESHGLVLFKGKEPNMHWTEFTECLIEVARSAGVKTIYFIGSVGGMVPHTREPRMFSAVSHPRLKEQMESHGLGFTDYEGPGSLVSYLLNICEERGLDMATVVAEIPPYVQGRNFKCIEAMIKKLSAMLGLTIELDEIRQLSDELEVRISEAITERPELAESIQKLEEDYDNQVFDTQMGDLKDWLEEKGIRLD